MNYNPLLTLLKNRKMSEYALSKISGIPYSTISDMCSGKTDVKKCNGETILKIAKALNTTMEIVIGEKQEEVAKFDDTSITIEEFYQYHLKNRKNVILYGTSALDYMRLTNGGYPLQIEVYSTVSLPFPFKVHKVKNFNDIDYQIIDGILVSTIDQSFNDMLKDEDTDYQALDESLSNYYYHNNESFDGLNILKSNLKRFNKEKGYAIKYYDTN